MEQLYRWTDELVEEFAKQYRFSSSRISIDMFKKDNPQLIEESEQEEMFDDIVHEVGKFFADETNEVSREEFVKELSSKYHLIKK